MLLGSVSHGVAQHAHRPVLIVPPEQKSGSRKPSDGANDSFFPDELVRGRALQPAGSARVELLDLGPLESRHVALTS